MPPNVIPFEPRLSIPPERRSRAAPGHARRQVRRVGNRGVYTRRIRRLARLLVAWAINVAALAVAHDLFAGVHIHGARAYLIGAAVLGVANTVLKPVLTILTLPLVLVTLGAFLLVINIAMVALAAWVTPGLSIHGFWTYVGTVVIVWIVNWAGDRLAASAPVIGRR